MHIQYPPICLDRLKGEEKMSITDLGKIIKIYVPTDKGCLKTKNNIDTGASL